MMRKDHAGWLSPAEVAEALGLTRRAVVAGRLRRALPWRRVSARCLRVRAVELERWLDAQRDGGAAMSGLRGGQP